MQIYLHLCDPDTTFDLDDYTDINGLRVIGGKDEIPVSYTFPYLCVDRNGLSLVSPTEDKAAPTRVDFLDARLAYRLETSRRSDGLPKAVGLDKSPDSLSVLDCTAGMGVDAYILAAMGCDVVMLEKNPLMAALLRDGLNRATPGRNSQLKATMQRLSFIHIDAHQYLDNPASIPDVIYLDPMFPVRQKSARVKKDMALMQQFLEPNQDVDVLMTRALAVADRRVVLKRPGKPDRKASLPNGRKPDFQVPGKACHFQVYIKV